MSAKAMFMVDGYNTTAGKFSQLYSNSFLDLNGFTWVVHNPLDGEFWVSVPRSPITKISLQWALIELVRRPEIQETC
jgi:hypothetical protein